MASCDGFYEPFTHSQVNLPESILKTSDVALLPLVSDQTYDLEAMTEDEQVIELASIECNNLPEGYSFGTIATISADDFATSTPLTLEVTPLESPGMWMVSADPDSVQAAYYNHIAKADDITRIKLRFLLTTVNNGQTAIVGGLDHYFGPYTLTIQPYPLTAPEYLYTPGDANGWDPAGSMKLFTSDFVTYNGFAVLGTGGFKFTSQPDWNGVNYGASDEEGVLDTDGGAGNLEVPVTGLYWCNVNPSALTYSLTEIETMGIIGDATEGGWDMSTPLTTTDYKTWTGTVYLLAGQFKFRANNAWDINLGGTADNLVSDGANIDSPGEGEYVVTLNLGQLPYTCTVTAK